MASLYQGSTRELEVEQVIQIKGNTNHPLAVAEYLPEYHSPAVTVFQFHIPELRVTI